MIKDPLGTEIRPTLHVPFRDYDELLKENKRLRDAFHEYGCHTESCGKMFWEDPNVNCTCGFDATRLALDTARGA